MLLKSIEFWRIAKEGYKGPENEDHLFTSQNNELMDKKLKDIKYLYQIYQTIEKQIYERITKTKTWKKTWETLQITHKDKDNKNACF